MKRYLEAYLSLFLIVGPILALDQWTKSLIRSNLEFMEIWVPWDWIEPYARIVHWKNTGAAFGMFQQFGDIFKILAILVSIGILYFYPQVPRREWLLRLALGLQMGGAVGNLIDRLTQGWVTDFISVGDFAVFNVADSSITVGVLVLLLAMWLNDRRSASQAERGPLSPPASPAEHPGE